MSRSPAVWRRGQLSLLVGALLLALVAPESAAAADPPSLHGRVASPTRGSESKGSGTPLASQPTGRLIVRYLDAIPEAARQRVRGAVGARLISRVALPNAELLEPTGAIAAAVAELKRRPDILSVDQEYRRSATAGPITEARFGEQWSLNNTGQTVGGYAGARDVDMNVPEAWQITTGSPSVTVAVIDDGVDFSHPDLSARAWVNPGEVAANRIDDDGNGLVDDINGWDFCHNDNSLLDAGDAHGTHVAGTIAASGNGAGTAGVAPTVRIMALKFLGSDPSCGTDSQAIAAIQYAAAHGAQVINASWGGPDDSQALAVAIEAADALFVAAAGNTNTDIGAAPLYPASYDSPNVLSVASIHNQGLLSDFSNYGFYDVDLSAPGEDVLSTLPGGAYGYMSGTSMAAANTSGTAALAASAHPSLAGGGDALRSLLIDTARALPSTLGWVKSPRMPDARAAVVSRPDVRRLAGADRYATSAAISAATYVPRVPYLFIATGANFPDALAGGPVAALVGAPLLLVGGTSIPTVVLNEIRRLKPYHIYVLGGPATVSEGVRTQLAAYDNAASAGPYRLAGSDRYATAAAISRSIFEPAGADVYVANGLNFPDALAGGPAGALSRAPILLTSPSSIPQATRQELVRLRPNRIIILGGTGSVSERVAQDLRPLAQNGVLRWAGPDRYATAAAIAAQAFPSSATAFIGSGLTFPDALSGGPPAGSYPAPLLLTAPSTLPTASRQQLLRLKPVRIYVLGGPGVVSDAIITQIRGLFP